MIIVCPDGGYAGWYLDSPLNKDSQYESYIVFDVVDYIDKNYQSIANEKGRALCGLSMGGQGALRLLAKYPKKFAAAGSMSGVMELASASKKLGIAQLLGDFARYPERWKQNSCLYLVEKLTGKEKGIILECGVEDRYLEGNRKVHSRLLALNINHDYYERPGGHTWDYWINALEYHLLYFHNFWKNQ
jgi:S-formylglutathione hydrolase FrmB